MHRLPIAVRVHTGFLQGEAGSVAVGRLLGAARTTTNQYVELNLLLILTEPAGEPSDRKSVV